MLVIPKKMFQVAGRAPGRPSNDGLSTCKSFPLAVAKEGQEVEKKDFGGGIGEEGFFFLLRRRSIKGGPDPFSDSVRRSDQLVREPSKTNEIAYRVYLSLSLCLSLSLYIYIYIYRYTLQYPSLPLISSF